MPLDVAQRALAPRALLRLDNGMLVIDIAPEAGGRIAQVTHRDTPWLVGHDAANTAAIAWGCYPMLPWAGRIRHGEFSFAGQPYQLPRTFGAHAIHGVGFLRPWQIEAHSATHCRLSLALPEDSHWPFGGVATHAIELQHNSLLLTLSLQAGHRSMPMPVLGWHPWFRKPQRLMFEPDAMYPRDQEGIATLPLVPPSPGPWDDCFVNHAPVRLHGATGELSLTSDSRHWVVYDQPRHATCVEPQTGPPDAFNLQPEAHLLPGQTLQTWFRWQWR
jgi:aldose 1-epimerase